MKIIAAIVVTIFLVGCGPTINERESYESVPYDAYKSGSCTVWLSISANQTVRNFIPFYYSSTQKAPYTLDIIVHSDMHQGKDITVLSAIVVIPNREKYQLVKTPISNKLYKKKWNTYADIRIQLQFGPLLKYQEGLEFDVHIEFLLPNSKEIHLMSVKFHSVKTQDKGTTWDVLMGV